MARNSVLKISYLLLLLLCVLTYAQGDDVTEESLVNPTKLPFKGAGFKRTKEGYYRLNKNSDGTKAELDSDEIEDGVEDDSPSATIDDAMIDSTADELTASLSSDTDLPTSMDAEKEVEQIEKVLAIAEQEHEDRKELGQDIPEEEAKLESDDNASRSDISVDMNLSNYESAAKDLSVEDMLTRDIRRVKNLAIVEGEDVEDAERPVEAENVLESNIFDLKASGVQLATEDEYVSESDLLNFDGIETELMSQEVAQEEQGVNNESLKVASEGGQSNVSPYDVVTCVRSMEGNKAAITIVCNIPLINFCQQDAGEECKLDSPSLSAIQTGDIPGLTHQFLFTADFSTLAQGLLNGGEIIHVPRNSNLNDFGMALLDYLVKHYNSWAVLSLDKIEDGVNASCASHVITCTMCKNDDFLKGRSHVAPLDIFTESVIGTDITRYNLDVTGVVKHLGEIIAPKAIHMLIREKFAGCSSVFNNAVHSPELHVHFEIPSSPVARPEGWEVKSMYATQWAAESNMKRLQEGRLLAALDNDVSNRFFLSANIPNMEFKDKTRAGLYLLLFRKQPSSFTECIKPHLIVTLLDEFPFDKEGKPSVSLQDINNGGVYTEHALEVDTQAYLLDISTLLHKFYEVQAAENNTAETIPMHIMVSEKSTGCSTLFANPTEPNAPQFTLIYDIKDSDGKPQSSNASLILDKSNTKAIEAMHETNQRMRDAVTLCVEGAINEGATAAVDSLFDGALEKFKVVGLSATDHVLMNLSSGEYDDSVITQFNASGRGRLSKHYARLASQAIADKGLSDTSRSAEWQAVTDDAISAGFESIRSIIMNGPISTKNQSLATKICTSILSKVAPNRVLDAAMVESSPNGEATTLMARHFNLVFRKADARKIMRIAFKKAYAAARDAAALMAINQAAFFAESTFVDLAGNGDVFDEDIDVDEDDAFDDDEVVPEEDVNPSEQPKYVRRHANQMVDSLNVFLYEDGLEKAKEAAELMKLHSGEDQNGSYLLGVSWDSIYYFGLRICAVFVGILIIGIITVLYYKWSKSRKAIKEAKPPVEVITTQPEPEQEQEQQQPPPPEPEKEIEPEDTPAPTEVECSSN